MPVSQTVHFCNSVKKIYRHLTEYPCLGHFLDHFPRGFLVDIWGFRRPYYELIICYFSLNYNHVCLRFEQRTFATQLTQICKNPVQIQDSPVQNHMHIKCNHFRYKIALFRTKNFPKKPQHSPVQIQDHAN